jgi:hypothetical protein
MRFVPLKTQRAQETPGARCTRSLACKVLEAHERSHHRFTGTPGISCAMDLAAYFVLSSVTGLVCHRRRRIWRTKTRLGSMHLRKLDASVGASGPHDFAVRISAVRLRAGRPLTSPIGPALRLHLRADAAASTASRPVFVTIASRPSVGRDGRICRDDLPDGAVCE